MNAKWGGKREGAGRPKAEVPSKTYGIKLPEDVYKAVKERGAEWVRKVLTDALKSDKIK